MVECENTFYLKRK